MCGIVGIVNFDGAKVDRSDVERMMSVLAHRGPDDGSSWVDGGVGFGHRRLAIRDLSENGRQPMHDRSGRITITYNGEIYNDPALRRTLERECGTIFHSTCDAAVIAPSYAKWGSDAFGRFEGMFALGLWDDEHKRLVLARDPVGIKPLYYSWNGRSFRFASEIKALLALPDQPRLLCPDSVHRFLAQGYPGPARTLIQGIHPLPPGSVMVVDAAGIRLEKYWTPNRRGEIRDMSAAVDEFIPLWKDVVQDMLISDVPVGILLSGGIDSSLVAAALVGRSDVPAFTARFAQADYDEMPLAAQVAAYAKLDHREISVDAAGSLEERFRKVVHHFDGQCADSSGLAFHAVCQEARRFVPVVLTGDGSDEFFGGYETYAASRLASRLAPIMPSGAAAALARGLSHFGRTSEARVPLSEKLARLFAGIAQGRGAHHPQWRRYLMRDLLNGLYGEAMAPLRDVDPLDEYGNAMEAPSLGLTDRCLLADQAYYLPGDLLVKSDAMSMAHSVEVRVPFLDRRIMEFAGKLHVSLLTPFGGPDKKLLRLVLERMGLPKTLTRARKRGFNVPVAHHLRHSLRPLCERLLDRDADVLAPLLLPDGVRALWREHAERRANHAYSLWTCLTLAVWREAAAV